MAKIKSSLDLSFTKPHATQPGSRWLYDALRAAILDGRLPPSKRLPSTRDLARQYRVSRGTVVTCFDRLKSEGYLTSRVGAGTFVSQGFLPRKAVAAARGPVPDYIGRTVADYQVPKPFVGLQPWGPLRPFRMGDVDLRAFPSRLWSSMASRRARVATSWSMVDCDPRGYRPLRQAIADYLGSSRGIACTANQVIIVTGTQQALDLLARLLVKPGERVWMEDPGYFGARLAFETVGAQIVPVPVDAEGLYVARGEQTGKGAVGAYVTPAHQFPLGMSMSAGRRAALLDWASRSGAFVIEDDYDSEFRFEGRPIPALMGSDRNSNVILVGSFAKLMFPALRIGYIVAPAELADLVVRFRIRTDFRSVCFEQAVLADFIERGHLSRHLHRMRDLYAGRLAVLSKAVREYLSGVIEIRNNPCGLYTVAALMNGMGSAEAETLIGAAGIEALALDRYTFSVPDPRGLLLGFAAFNGLELRDGVRRLARALERPKPGS